MGYQKYGRGTVQRQTHAHLDRKENGDIYAVFKLDFTANARRFEYCFIGADENTLSFDSQIIHKHPKFKNVEQFENWCRRYFAEHDL